MGYSEYSDSLSPSQDCYRWHKKPVGSTVCPTCACKTVRANVRHRRTIEGKFEKIIKVCFGTDTSIEPT